jgi:hypothetical protein
LESKFKSSSITNFWLSVSKEYPEMSEALKYLMPFSSTYLCEKAFSALTYIKNKYRSSLSNVETELRLCLTKIEPRIKDLCCKKQSHPSH